MHRLIILIFLSLCAFSCSDRKPDIRLTRVEELASENPRKALDSLKLIDHTSLSEPDRQLFDFLQVKCNDKAFETHISDSLIKTVINYESAHKERGRYAEALFLGGRVYHDMGDYSEALRHYQRALGNLSGERPENPLRRKILSQMIWVLNSLRLHKEALQYVREVLTLDSLAGDSLVLMYNLELSGHVNLDLERYDEAEDAFKKALSIAREISSGDSVSHRMSMAAIKYHKGQTDSALNLIRPTLRDIDSISRNFALAYACDIYLDASIPDTAIMYARELIGSKDPRNQKTGYRILLSDKFRRYLPLDTIVRYVSNYRDIIESYLDKNGDREALMQNSLYNYQTHKRARIKTEQDKRNLYRWIFAIAFVAVAAAGGMLYYKNQGQRQRIRLLEALDKVNTLRRLLDKSMAGKKPDGESRIEPHETKPHDEVPNNRDLRLRLRNELLSLRDSSKPIDVPPVILESEAYGKLQEYIKGKCLIKDSDPLWDELEAVVLQVSPDFKSKLQLLAGGKLKPSDFRIPLLLKCGVSPSNMSVLIGRAKATISYRRETLGMKVFDEKKDMDMVDDIIRLL